MASFAFIVDVEEGHLFPTFGLSRSLKARGHVVHYIGIADIENSVRDQGFEFHAILENQYPKGFYEAFKKAHFNKGNYSKFTFVDSIENELPVLFERIKPEGVIISTYLSLEALFLYYRYGIEPLIFMPELNSNPLHEFRYEFGSLGERQYDIFQHYNDRILKKKKPSLLERIFSRKKKKINDAEFQQFILPLQYFKYVIACPEEFEIPDHVKRNSHYIGPCIRNKTNTSFDLVQDLRQKNKKIVYVSLGSQTERIHEACESLYLKIIDLLLSDPEMADYHVVLSSKMPVDLRNTISIPDNMTIVAWADALAILEISSAIITHGGLGLIKESIFYGVPMLILPDKYDQPRNAERVVYHQLGIKGDLINITGQDLKAHLQTLTKDQRIKENLNRMQAIFRRKDELHEGAIFIEEIFVERKKQF